MPSAISRPSATPAATFRRKRGDDANAGTDASFSTDTLVWVFWLSVLVWLTRANTAS